MAKNKSTNKSGYKYEHKHSTILQVENGIKIIKQRDIKKSFKMPNLAEDGDKEYIALNKENKPKQIREFNELTNDKTKDIDLLHSEQGKIVDQHAHDWVNGKRQPARQLTKEERQKIEEINNLQIPDKNFRYYDIDENLAKRANDANSFNDYKKGSETEGYRANVDEVFDLADKVKNEITDPQIKAKADYLADLYAKKYAKWVNDKNRIDGSVPSILITGAGNFPVKKKERQNQQREKNFEEYDKIQKIKEDLQHLKYYKPKVEKQGHADTTHYNFNNKHCEVIQNEELNRLQLKFNGKPNDKTREILKQHAFKWSPTNGVWQRQLTPNARWTTERMLKKLDELDNN